MGSHLAIKSEHVINASDETEECIGHIDFRFIPQVDVLLIQKLFCELFSFFFAFHSSQKGRFYSEWFNHIRYFRGTHLDWLIWFKTVKSCRLPAGIRDTSIFHFIIIMCEWEGAQYLREVCLLGGGRLSSSELLSSSKMRASSAMSSRISVEEEDPWFLW